MGRGRRLLRGADLRHLREHRVRVGLGTDVGGGTSLSLLKTMREAYKVMHLQQQPLPPGRALYLATLGAAETLYLDDRIGNFAPGNMIYFGRSLGAAVALQLAVEEPPAGTIVGIGDQAKIPHGVGHRQPAGQPAGQAGLPGDSSEHHP